MPFKIYNSGLLLFTFINLNLYLAVETEQPISVYDISEEEVSKYAALLQKGKGLPSLIKDSFDLHFQEFRGITDQELQVISKRVSDKVLQAAINQVVLIGDGGKQIKNARLSYNNNGYKTAFVAFRMNSDGKYDVVYCLAEQVRDINWEKIGYAAVIAGGTAVAVSLAMPGVGLVIGGAIVGATVTVTACAATAIGAYQNNYVEMENALLGYIGKELKDKRLLPLA